MDTPWVIHGYSMDYPWMIHGLSMDYPWIICGLSMDNPGHPWISMDFQGWGNQPAHLGGTARPVPGEPLARPPDSNAFLIKKVRTHSGKPGWGINSYTIRLCFIRIP